MAIISVLIHARFDSGDPIILKINEELDTHGDWMVWVKESATKINNKEFPIHIFNCRKSEIKNKVDNSTIAFYVGNMEIIYIANKTPSNQRYGKLVLQVEKSKAAIENRNPRKFLGVGVRYV